MKKVKVTLNPGSNGKKFYLFPSAEALYVWACAIEADEHVQVPEIKELLLEPGGFIESELMGFEYDYDKNRYKRFDLVRLAKAQQTSNASGMLVTVHSGWVIGGLLPMKNYSDTDITVKVLESDEGILDFAVLFNDDHDIDVEEDEDDDK